MKKTLVYGTATALITIALGAGASLSQCSHTRPVQTLYGSPPEKGSEPATPDDQSDDESTPQRDRVVVLYGPPPIADERPAENSPDVPSENTDESDAGGSGSGAGGSGGSDEGNSGAGGAGSGDDFIDLRVIGVRTM